MNTKQKNACLPKRRDILNHEEKSKQHKKPTNFDPNPNASAQYTGIEVLNHASFLVLLKGLRGPLL